MRVLSVSCASVFSFRVDENDVDSERIDGRLAQGRDGGGEGDIKQSFYVRDASWASKDSDPDSGSPSSFPKR